MEVEEHKVTVAAYDCHSENEYEYDDYTYEMVAALKDIGSVWDVEVSNGNWRGQTGHMTSSDPEKIADSLLMHDGRCRTEVWMDGNGLSGVCYHHDAPTGSWFKIKINEDECT